MLRLGFIGLGYMGSPMAINLSRKFPLNVWNRTPARYDLLQGTNTMPATTPQQVLDRSDLVFSMLFDEAAMRSILTDELKVALRGKTLINTSSVSVDFSHWLANEVSQAGGHFVEMPVSGSRVPAERGELIGLLAGDPAVIEPIRPYLEPITSSAVYCGHIGSGLKMKYAANLYLIAITVGLAESMSMAQVQGLDLEAYAQVLNAGQMASPYSKVKMAKLLREDWAPQATISDCYNSTQLIDAAAKEAGADLPLIKLCGDLYRQAKDGGLEDEDMIAINKILRSRKRKAG